jgi:hypothetical protein
MSNRFGLSPSKEHVARVKDGKITGTSGQGFPDLVRALASGRLTFCQRASGQRPQYCLEAPCDLLRICTSSVDLHRNTLASHGVRRAIHASTTSATDMPDLWRVSPAVADGGIPRPLLRLRQPSGPDVLQGAGEIAGQHRPKFANARCLGRFLETGGGVS